MLSIITDNPIVTREMRRRMRGKAMIYSLIAYVAVLCIVTLVILLMNAPGLYSAAKASFDQLEKLQRTGDQIFNGLVIIQGLLVLIMAPAITASLITSEREKKTDDFLRVTTLPPYHYVVGAFFSTVLYVLLLLGCALPIVSITLLFGGRALDQIFIMFGGLFLSSMVLTSLGIYTSSIHEKTRTSQGVMLGIAIIFFILVWNLEYVLDGIYIYLNQTSPKPFGKGLIQFYSFYVPDWIMAAVPPLLLSMLFLSIASRKVYNFENRPLNYLYYIVINIICFLALTGLIVNATGNISASIFLWYILSLILFIIGAVIYTSHQVDVGSENWRLHQRLPILAKVDDAIIFIGLYFIGWFAAGYLLFGAYGEKYSQIFTMLAINLLGPVLFLAVLGRYLALKIIKRQLAFRILIGIVFVVWIIIPLILVIPFGGISNLNPFFALFVEFSPLFSIWLYFEFTDEGIKTASALLNSKLGLFQSAVYLIASSVLYFMVIRENIKWQNHLKALILDASQESIEKELELSN